MSLVAMKVWIRGRSGAVQRLRRALDVLAAGARETADAGLLQLARDRAHRLEVAFARDREARLDHVDAQLFQLARQSELLVQVHAAPGRLLAVAQRGVEDAQQLGAHGFTPGRLSAGSAIRWSGRFASLR